ncbi:nuclear transport factor 2 family protein [Bowmanella yangjiangensis]|uniref:Nuclear transport factor 2 family protein n=1 Tax=Bowmanella yangjiangensis TaxID=2811230 RepID=A0ABS3CVN5_9ALTE|nr:nuclear transport factor 2 family protein [Bowmanella yangjiangensis]MBN7821150.1 nuclear transport factor 2 family protein [Bowmanella yangjiangensis]
MRCALIISLLLVVSLPAKADLAAGQLEQLARGFLQAKQAKQQPNTQLADIEHFISLFADEFTDEHVKFNVVMSDKAELRKGLLHKMQDKVSFCTVEMTDLMLGRNVAFVKYREHAKVHPSHMPEPVEYSTDVLLSMEFNQAGQITRLRRFHSLPEQKGE